MLHKFIKIIDSCFEKIYSFVRKPIKGFNFGKMEAFHVNGYEGLFLLYITIKILFKSASNISTFLRYLLKKDQWKV